MEFNENSLFLFHICHILSVSHSKNDSKVHKPSIYGVSLDPLSQLAYAHCEWTTHGEQYQHKTRVTAPIQKSQIDECGFCDERMSTATAYSDLVRWMCEYSISLCLKNKSYCDFPCHRICDKLNRRLRINLSKNRRHLSCDPERLTREERTCTHKE